MVKDEEVEAGCYDQADAYLGSVLQRVEGGYELNMIIFFVGVNQGFTSYREM